MRSFARLSAGLVLITVLAACSFSLPRWTPAPEADPQAEAMLRAGDYEGARQRFEFLARSARVPDYYWFRAADAAFRGGDTAGAQQLVDAIHTNELDPIDRNQYLLLSSRLDLSAGRARQAMTKLNALAVEQLVGGQVIDYHTARASAYNQLGDMLASARERVALGRLLTAPDAIARNNEAIYDALRRLPPQQLQGGRPPPDELGGWMALTELLETTPAAQRAAAVAAWQERYPRHPANGPFLATVLAESGRRVPAPPARAGSATPKPVTVAQPVAPIEPPPSGPFIGVMLPLSGAYAPAAQAIRTGMTAAYFADERSAKPPLHFVDTEGRPVRDLYRQLVTAGAVGMIGPLVKDQVADLAGSAELSIPVLALNQVPTAQHAQLYQFGLVPEQEVEQAAGSAWFDGRQNALVLAPATTFGQRITKAFTNYWKSLGGKISASKTYPQHGTDLAGVVKALLPNPTAPESAGGNFVFLIADSRDARTLMPLLNALDPGLPVYATSHVYNGSVDPQGDRDLKGLVFCDIPWLLNPDEGGPLSARALAPQIQQTPPDYVKLIALGVDAYRLLLDLNRFKTDSFYRYAGLTGNLSLQSGNRFQRQLECAQFEEGGLQLRGQAPLLSPVSGLPSLPDVGGR